MQAPIDPARCILAAELRAQPATKRRLPNRTFINGVLSGNILIDTTQAATETIDYVATDTWGNTATSTRTVIIDANPNVATTSPSNAGVIATSTPTAAQQASVSRIG